MAGEQLNLWTGQAEPKDSRPREKVSRHDSTQADVVYGEARSSRGLVFIPKAWAQDLAATYHAVASSTWGDLKAKASPELLEEVLEMMDLEEAPADELSFDLDDIPAVNDGDWPDWPEQMMLRWIPREVLDEYGRYESSMLNGPFGVLDESREDEIVAALERLGYFCVRDDELIAHCFGQ